MIKKIQNYQNVAPASFNVLSSQEGKSIKSKESSHNVKHQGLKLISSPEILTQETGAEIQCPTNCFNTYLNTLTEEDKSALQSNGNCHIVDDPNLNETPSSQFLSNETNLMIGDVRSLQTLLTATLIQIISEEGNSASESKESCNNKDNQDLNVISSSNILTKQTNLEESYFHSGKSECQKEPLYENLKIDLSILNEDLGVGFLSDTPCGLSQSTPLCTPPTKDRTKRKGQHKKRVRSKKENDDESPELNSADSEIENNVPISKRLRPRFRPFETNEIYDEEVEVNTLDVISKGTSKIRWRNGSKLPGSFHASKKKRRTRTKKNYNSVETNDQKETEKEKDSEQNEGKKYFFSEDTNNYYGAVIENTKNSNSGLENTYNSFLFDSKDNAPNDSYDVSYSEDGIPTIPKPRINIIYGKPEQLVTPIKEPKPKHQSKLSKKINLTKRPRPKSKSDEITLFYRIVQDVKTKRTHCFFRRKNFPRDLCTLQCPPDCNGKCVEAATEKNNLVKLDNSTALPVPTTEYPTISIPENESLNLLSNLEFSGLLTPQSNASPGSNCNDKKIEGFQPSCSKANCAKSEDDFDLFLESIQADTDCDQAISYFDPSTFDALLNTNEDIINATFLNKPVPLTTQHAKSTASLCVSSPTPNGTDLNGSLGTGTSHCSLGLPEQPNQSFQFSPPFPVKVDFSPGHSAFSNPIESLSPLPDVKTSAIENSASVSNTTSTLASSILTTIQSGSTKFLGALLVSPLLIDCSPLNIPSANILNLSNFQNLFQESSNLLVGISPSVVTSTPSSSIPHMSATSLSQPPRTYSLQYATTQTSYPHNYSMQHTPTQISYPHIYSMQYSSTSTQTYAVNSVTPFVAAAPYQPLTYRSVPISSNPFPQ